MAGLLTAQHRSLGPHRGQHVTVADVGCEHVNASLAHQPVEAEVRHRRHRDRVDTEGKCEHCQDLVAVERGARLVYGEHTVAVAVERDPEVIPTGSHDLLQQAQVGGAAAGVDVRSIRRRGNRRHLGAQLFEHAGGNRRIGAVRTVDGDPEAVEAGAEMLEDVLDIPVGRVVRHLDRPAAHGSRVEEGLDRLLIFVGQLVAFGVEELDPVVLGWVMRGREDDAKVLREERDGRSRQHSSENGNPAAGDDPPDERLLERRPGAACVATDEDATASCPHRGGAAESLDEIKRERVADDAAHAIGSEVSTSYFPRRNAVVSRDAGAGEGA